MVSKIVFATNYSTVTTTTCYNAAGQPLSTVLKQLISQLSSTLESKSVFVSERGLTSTQWSEYSGYTKRIQYSAVPTSDITAEAVTVDGNVTLHQRYIYRGYLQIACIDLTRAAHPALWYITWDPTQPVATRPLAIQKDATWYTYGWDLTKNICEVYGQHGYLRTAYTCTPYGQVTAEGDVTQPIQWSSEFNDTELGLIYYNYRHYNPVDGRWLTRDIVKAINDYIGMLNSPSYVTDYRGGTILHVPEKYKGEVSTWGDKRPSILEFSDYAGVSNKTISELLAMVDRMNSIECKEFKKHKFKIDVFQRSINLAGVMSLPWEGYDMAVLISHTVYKSEFECVIKNHGQSISSHEVPGFKNGRLVIFGCHLSRRPNVKLTHMATLREVMNYLMIVEMHATCSCKSPMKIQIVSGDF